MRLINTLSAVLSERVQMEHKLAQLRPTWGRACDDLNELAAILSDESRLVARVNNGHVPRGAAAPRWTR